MEENSPRVQWNSVQRLLLTNEEVQSLSQSIKKYNWLIYFLIL